MITASIIIPTIRKETDIVGLIKEIQDTATCSQNLFVASSDGSAAHNRNVGLDNSMDSDFIIMCDDDIEQLPKHWDKRLIDALEETKGSIVGARLFNPDGKIQPVCYGNYDLLKDFVETKSMITSLCAFRNSILRFDENFIGWGWEDTDFCKQLGGKSFVINTVRVVHRNEHKNPLGSKEQEHTNRDYFLNKWRDQK